MATSSIKTNFIIKETKRVNAFADAVEASAKSNTQIDNVSAKRLSSSDIKCFMAKRGN